MKNNSSAMSLKAIGMGARVMLFAAMIFIAFKDLWPNALALNSAPHGGSPSGVWAFRWFLTFMPLAAIVWKSWDLSRAIVIPMLASFKVLRQATE